MVTWAEKLQELRVADVFLPHDGTPADPPFGDRPWSPTPADTSAAWHLVTTLRSRLHARVHDLHAGDEVVALRELEGIPGAVRDVLTAHEGCVHVAALSLHFLDEHLRPFLARWKPLDRRGTLESSDVAHRFRRHLTALHVAFDAYLQVIGHLAGADLLRPPTAPPGPAPAARHLLGGPLPFGIREGRVAIPFARAIDADERREVGARRRSYGLADDDNDAIGLAISGGGIRSATFALGVVQVLARRGVLQQVDFLSTVSGGGYLGSFLSTYLNAPADPDVGLDPTRHTLPLGGGAAGESTPVRHLRNHGKYLAGGGAQTLVLVVGMMLFGIAVNLLLTLPWLGIAAVLARVTMDEALEAAAFYPPQGPVRETTFWFGGVLVGSAFVLPLVQRAALRFPALRSFSRWWELGWCGGLLISVLLLLVWGAVPVAYPIYQGLTELRMLNLVPGFSHVTLPVLVGLLPLVATALQAASTRWRAVRKVPLLLLAAAGPLGFLVGFFALLDYLLGNVDQLQASTGALMDWLGADTIYGDFPHPDTRYVLTVSGLTVLLLLFGSLAVNINFTSPHRYYRYQLSRTYLRRRGGDENSTVHDDELRLSQLNGGSEPTGAKAPYHLINCAVNLPGSESPELRGRNSDFFVFSKHWCGSPVTGFAATSEWEAIDGHLNLGTAMAISAAAASPQMGAIPVGGISSLLAVLNVRLNYWARPPRTVEGQPRGPLWWRQFNTPGNVCMFKEMSGLGMTERSSFLNLSDGGHIENLAIYELLRRRCRFVVAIDGEADPTRSFGGLMNLVRLAHIDFGVRIEPDLEQLRTLGDGTSRAHYLLCPIQYDAEARGLLLYLKSSMTGNESELLRKYHAENPDFPHETTADQLFDEAQFEAYRALGEHIGHDLFGRSLVHPGTGAPLPALPTVRDWFEALAHRLLPRPA